MTWLELGVLALVLDMLYRAIYGAYQGITEALRRDRIMAAVEAEAVKARLFTGQHARYVTPTQAGWVAPNTSNRTS